MDRPLLYEKPYVVNRNIPYEMIEQLPSGDYLSGGVLRKGVHVWMQHEPLGTLYRRSVSVYAENIGIIDLDPHFLSQLD